MSYSVQTNGSTGHCHVCPVLVLLEAHTQVLSDVMVLQLCMKGDLLVPLQRRH